MRRAISAITPLLLMSMALIPGVAAAQSFKADVAPMIDASCMYCHMAVMQSAIDIENLGDDLSDPATFRAWEKIYDRVDRGEMPPVGAPKAADTVVQTAMSSLNDALVAASLDARDGQRSALRRLTRLEYAYTVQDLLQIEAEVGATLGQMLPAEADSGGFDTVAAKQGISPLHVRSYLDAADRSIDAAIVLGPRPPTARHEIKYAESGYLNFMHDAEILGGGITKKLDDGVVMFFDTGSTYMMHSESEGYAVPYPGQYRVGMEVRAYQAGSPVTATLYRGVKQGVTAQLSDLIGSFDLLDDTYQAVEVKTYLRPGHLLAPSVADLDMEADALKYYQPTENIKDYDGEGIAIKSMTIEGPLIDTWPPPSTRQLLTGVEFDADGQVQLTRAPYEHIVDIVARFAPLAFRRPLEDGELEAYASLAKPLLADGRPFLEAVRVPLRAILSAPPFLYQTGSPGALDDYGLATRLSYFLWRSMPDAELFALARAGRLSDPKVLASQVERMLGDTKSKRFVDDFAGQAFRLYELNATSPDKNLYPEYDDRLGQAMARETELFLAELFEENLGIANLIDADFSFVNRRLAEHYDIDGVQGQQMRKVALAPDSPRGGLLGQASIHKITANGTTTSPVPRGNFVLANVLGKPAPPPPPNVAGLEPDTRGTTTIREQLAAHRANPTCANCHRMIDPPGFALESFDPIGGFRTNYRITREAQYGEYTVTTRHDGLAVDPSGVTPTGGEFAGFEEYKRLLLDNDLDQVSRNVVSKLLVYATGAEIEFADREAVEQIVAKLRADGYPMRTMIHEVVDSDLFRMR